LFYICDIDILNAKYRSRTLAKLFMHVIGVI